MTQLCLASQAPPFLFLDVSDQVQVVVSWVEPEEVEVGFRAELVGVSDRAAFG